MRPVEVEGRVCASGSCTRLASPDAPGAFTARTACEPTGTGVVSGAPNLQAASREVDLGANVGVQFQTSGGCVYMKCRPSFGSRASIVHERVSSALRCVQLAAVALRIVPTHGRPPRHEPTIEFSGSLSLTEK